MTKIALTDLRPNPFRDLRRLPVKPEKVEALMESIKETTFWDNIVCRKAPNGTGGYEIAYGHNRLAALKKLRWTEVDIPVRVLDNDTMAKIMARENHEEWGAYAEVDCETVRSVIQAFGDGLITLPRERGGGHGGKVRLAPGFEFVPRLENLENAKDDKTYTIEQLSQFLGWRYSKAQAILGILTFKATDKLSQAIDFDGLTATQADRVVRQARRVMQETDDQKLAFNIAKQLSNDFRSSNTTARHDHNVMGRIVSTDTIHARTNELMRGSRVKNHIEKRKAKEIRLSLQKEDRQVAVFLDACKAWEKAMEAATHAISKFSPEAKQFSIRRLAIISQIEILLRGKLK